MAMKGPTEEEPDRWSQLPPIDHDALDAEDERLDDLEDAEAARLEALGAPEPDAVEPVLEADVPSYELRSTSLQTASAEPIALSLRTNDDGSTTRRVITPTLLNQNRKNPAAKVKIKIHHQRRANRNAAWEKVRTFRETTLKAGEQVSLDLHSEEVLLLYNHLTNLYAMAEGGVRPGSHELQVVDKSRGVAVFAGQQAQLLTQLIEKYGNDDLFSILRKLKPNLLAAAGLQAIQEGRMAALKEFEDQMTAKTWTEGQWYPFFEKNPWILGHGLSYRFLQNVQGQPAYGGLSVSGKGIQRGDNLMATTASIRFSVLVEVKRPDTRLLDEAIYRNGAYNPAEDLTGGVAQLQANCRTWAIEGSKLEGNEDLEIETYEPRGILVIGDLSEFNRKDKKPRTRSFELFRRNLHNPEVLTFDELLARARYLVSTAVAPNIR
jgi:hypothetical protein